jgi:hypothetical protein
MFKKKTTSTYLINDTLEDDKFEEDRRSGNFQFPSGKGASIIYISAMFLFIHKKRWDQSFRTSRIGISSFLFSHIKK